MAIPVRERLITAEQFARIPDEPGVRRELVRGRVVRMTPGGVRHFRVITRLTKLFIEYEERSGAAVLLLTTGCKLAEAPDTVREPDLALVRRERFREVGEIPGFYPGSPDFVVEVLSPTDRPGAIREKIAQYFDRGVRMIWVVDPERESISVHEPDREPRTLQGDDVAGGGELFPDLRCALHAVFSAR